MPTYEYECQACGHAFEELQAMTDPKLMKCPKCHKKKLARLIGSGSGMIFKGSGFYETDYKKKPAPAGDKKDSSKPAAKSAASPAPAPAAGCGGGCACHPH
jgi:putative FmdB family regulatory protein